MYPKAQMSDPTRIKLDEKILDKFFKDIFRGKVSELAVEKGLPYRLVYNLAHGRISSLSAEDYKILFGEELPYLLPERVRGTSFRGMVRLWLYLNDGVTKADLYREFYLDKQLSKVDYRIFSGKVKTVEGRLERIMERKFIDQGFDRLEIKEAIEELDLIRDDERVPYEQIKPVLDYLKENLRLSPTSILNQNYLRYERGELRTAPKKAYDYALKLKKETEKALDSGSKTEIEKLREKIYGKREGLVLYAEVEDKLKFLQKYGGKSPKKYLGRSIKNYEKSILKRVASSRAERIAKDCNELISNKPELTILSLPKSNFRTKLGILLSVLKSYVILRMTETEGKIQEKRILTPQLYRREEYGAGKDALVVMDRAAYSLKMSKRAFDLMVAGNREIFRKIASYDGRWHLPRLYLKELLEKEGFSLVKAKYEVLAEVYKKSFPPRESIARTASEEKPSQPRTSQSYSNTRKLANYPIGNEGFIYHRITSSGSYGPAHARKASQASSGLKYPTRKVQYWVVYGEEKPRSAPLIWDYLSTAHNMTELQ
jgi:hypothetical protein